MSGLADARPARDDGSRPRRFACPVETKVVTRRGAQARGVAFTKLTSERPARLTKAFHLGEDGKVVKEPGGHMAAGRAEVVEIATPEDFAKQLASAGADTAFAYGTITEGRQKARVTTKVNLRGGKARDLIARSRDDFEWPGGPGIAMLDYDPVDKVLKPDDLISVLEAVAPKMADVGLVHAHSASSFIYHGKKKLKGLGGQRLYFIVEDARDIERAMGVLVKRLWLTGQGRIQISSAGSMLERTLFDTSVWQPERLDFVGGADCERPLEQRRPPPEVVKGDEDRVDTRAALPDLTEADEERYREVVAEAKQAAQSEAERVREAWRVERGKEAVTKARSAATGKLTREQENRVWEGAYAAAGRATDNGELTGDFQIVVLPKGEGGEEVEVSVDEILADPERFDGMLTLDPLEPEYADFKVVGRLHLVGTKIGKPVLVSMAHGQKTYRLGRDLRGTVIQLADKLRETHGGEKFERKVLRADPVRHAADIERRVAALDEDADPAVVEELNAEVAELLAGFPAAAIQRREIVFEASHPSVAVEETQGFLQYHPDIYGMGESISHVDQLGKVEPLDDDVLLRHFVDREVGYVTSVQKKKKKEKGKDGKDVTVEVWEDTPISPPPVVAQTVVRMRAKGLRPLQAVVDTPALRPDGSVVTTRGYDPVSQLFIAPASEMPEVPVEPTLEQARAALDTLMRPYAEFPYVSPADRGAMLAAQITAVIRRSLPTAPAFMFDAPTRGSGKTLQASMTAAMTGKRNPGQCQAGVPGKEEELEKRLGTEMMAGAQAIIFDNVVGELNSPTLAAVLTSASFGGRVLGKSESINVPNRMLTLFTSNNAKLSEDLVRRTVAVRINPELENPESRSGFSIPDPLNYVIEHRLEMAAAALALVRARLTLGVGMQMTSTGSFNEWSRFVRDTVVWVGREIDAGYGDPGDTMKRSQENDPERNDWSTILSGLRDAFGDEWVKASDIYDVIFKQRSITSGKSMGPRAREDLREAFEGLMANGGEVRSSRSLGQMLNFRIDRLVAGLVLRRRWERTKTSVFRVEMSEERSKDVSATGDVQRSSREAA